MFPGGLLLHGDRRSQPMRVFLQPSPGKPVGTSTPESSQAKRARKPAACKPDHGYSKHPSFWDSGKGCTALWGWWGLQVPTSRRGRVWCCRGQGPPSPLPAQLTAPFHSQPSPSFPSGCSLSSLFSSGVAIFPG